MDRRFICHAHPPITNRQSPLTINAPSGARPFALSPSRRLEQRRYGVAGVDPGNGLFVLVENRFKSAKISLSVESTSVESLVKIL
jgi:hypothetical protein